MECLRRAGADQDRLHPAAAARACTAAFLMGDFDRVAALAARMTPAGAATVDGLRVLQFAATSARITGDTAGLRTFAAQAKAAATGPVGPRAGAALHQVLAMRAAADGDPQSEQWHRASALADAEQAGDTAALAWIRICGAVRTLDLEAPQQIVAQAQTALCLGEHAGSPFLIAHARSARGWARLRQGAIGAADEDFRVAIDLFTDLGSHFVAWPLSGLGDLDRMRGRPVHARATYEEALGVAERCRDVLATGTALAGLARTRAVDDTSAARALAQRAVGLREPLHEVRAALTRGWIELLDGNRQAATADAAVAATTARRTANRPGLAEAVTLTVLSAAEPATQSGELAEAVEIWRDNGCPVQEAATRILAAQIGLTIPGPSADQAAATLRNCGLDPDTCSSVSPPGVLATAPPAVTIHALGAFRVTHNGVAVTRTLWQSKKARDLLKILVARRRPTPREHLMELLWPETEPSRSGKRLSVLLTMIRDILQPRAEHPQPLMTDGEAVWLDPTAVAIDVEDFLAMAGRALDADRAGHPDAASRLAAAAAAYTGEFLADDPYPDWATDVTEEVRATHLAVLRALVVHRRAQGDIDDLVRQSLRLLKEDPYDEHTHLALVTALRAARRLGEANRHYTIYVRRMAEMGLPARPMPAPARSHPTMEHFSTAHSSSFGGRAAGERVPPETNTNPTGTPRD